MTSLLSLTEYTSRAFALMRQFRPLVYDGSSVFRWYDGRGRLQEDRIAVTPFELPPDHKDAEIVLALITHFRPGEPAPAKMIGPLVGVDDAVNNGAFMRRLRSLAESGWLIPTRGNGYRVHLDRSPEPTAPDCACHITARV